LQCQSNNFPKSTREPKNHLLIDDQEEERKALAAALERDGFDVEAFEADRKADSRSGDAKHCDVVVSKLQARADGGGIRLMHSLRRKLPETPLITIAAQDQLQSAVEAVQNGASDCLSQPVQPEELSASIRRVLSIHRDERLLSTATDARGDEPEAFAEIVGDSPAMQKVFVKAQRVAPTSSTVLITGATGTGKELLASAIHRLSRRRHQPLIAINAAAVPSTLIESELFGHVKGAFTDADTDRIGRFEAADGGTLFIDEIGDLKLPSQAKLLRVLESRVINRVGSNDEIPVDVRVLAATSRNLEELVASGKFREDLYYRFNVVRINLPELSERKEDIPILANHFLNDLAEEHQLPPKQIDQELLDYLCEHPWPGNIRQFKNCLESMLVMSPGDRVTLDDLPDNCELFNDRKTLAEFPLAGCSLAELEREAIEQTLERFEGNRTRSADALGVSVRTLQRKLKQWKTDESA